MDLTDGEGSLVSVCDGWFTESESWMQNQRARYRANERLYNGDITLNLPARHTQLEFNIALADIETQLPIISDYMPTFDVMPVQQDDEDFANQMQARKGQIEKKCHLRNRLLDAVKDSQIYGDGIITPLPIINNGTLTGLDIKIRDVFTWFPAPGSTSIDIHKSRYQIFATPTHVDEIRRMYGVEVRPEGYLDEYRGFTKTETSSGDDRANMALLKECYRMDEDRKKYPYGRYTVWANNTLLVDEPLWDGVEIFEGDDYEPPMPVFKISNYATAHSLFGIGEPYLVRTSMKCLCEIMSSLAENVKKTGNPIRRVLRSWVNTAKKMIQGIAGEEVVVDNPNDVDWVQPPNIPASTFQFIDLLMRLNDVVTGVHDVTEGRKPTGITAGNAIIALQEAAQARVRYKIANGISEWIELIGMYIVFLIKQYDKVGLTIRKTSSTGEMEYIMYDPKQTSQGRYDVEVVSGTRMPTGRYADEERARQKFLDGIYGIEEYAANSSESDKQSLIQGFYRRQGLDMAMKHQQDLNDAMAQLEQLVAAALDNPDGFIGTPQEEQTAALIQQYPELVQTQEFMALPAAVKERLVMVFVAGTPEGEAA